MLCTNCQREIADGSPSCPYCGAAVSAPPAAGPEQGGENRRRLWIAAAAAVGAAVLIAVVVVCSGLFTGPKGQLTKALTKSLGAYHTAAASLELPDFSQPMAERELSQRFSVELKELSSLLGEEYSVLEGLGFRLEANSSMPQRKSDATVTLFYHAKDLLACWTDIRDTVVTAGSPQLLGETAIGLDTTTLGQDLANLSPELEELRDLNFNLFDMIENLTPERQQDAAAIAALLDAIEVEKTQRAAMAINGQQQDCQGYLVTVPADAMLAYLQSAREAAKAQDNTESLLEALRSMGVPEEELAEMEPELRDAMDNTQFFDSLEAQIQESGDLTLEVYTSDGCIAAVTWTGTAEDIDTTVTLHLGGGENYVDDLGLDITGGGHTIRLTSSGRHGGEDGTFTDSTAFRIVSGGSTAFSLQSDLTYRPKETSGNFDWGLRIGDVSLQLEGQVDTGKDTLDAQMDTCSIRFYGMEIVNLGVTWQAGPYSGGGLSAPDIRMLSELDPAGLEELSGIFTDNVMVWAQNVLYEIPELLSLFL